MDSGSELNILAEGETKKFTPPPQLTPSRLSAKAVNGTKVKFKGQIVAKVTLDGKTVPITLQISPNTTTNIIGIPGLFELNIAPTPNGKFIHLEKMQGLAPIHTRGSATIAPFATKRILMTQKNTQADGASGEKAVVVMARPSTTPSPRIVAGIYTAKENRVSVLMANPTPNLYKSTQTCLLESLMI